MWKFVHIWAEKEGRERELKFELLIRLYDIIIVFVYKLYQSDFSPSRPCPTDERVRESRISIASFSRILEKPKNWRRRLYFPHFLYIFSLSERHSHTGYLLNSLNCLETSGNNFSCGISSRFSLSHSNSISNIIPHNCSIVIVFM